MSFPSHPRAVVTGAAGGFGRAVALTLATDHGARLILSDVDEAGLSETARRVERAGGEARTALCDVREASEVERLAELADEAFAGADILVNNAGVAVAGVIGEVPLEDWKWQIDINLWGVIHGCHSFVPRMKQKGSGWVLNVASAAGLLSAPTMGPYNVTKAGVVALSETLYGELAGTDVHVTALCPTFFRTRIHENTRTVDPSLRARTEKLVTRSRWSAEQVARIALDGLRRGDLYVIPQPEGRAMWRAKRLLGARFHGLAGQIAKNPRWLRWLSGS